MRQVFATFEFRLGELRAKLDLLAEISSSTKLRFFEDTDFPELRAALIGFSEGEMPTALLLFFETFLCIKAIKEEADFIFKKFIGVPTKTDRETR